MPDFETFLIAVYVLLDEVAQSALPPEPHRPGRPPALARSEVLTLALISQLARFRSERDFSRFAAQHLRGLFPHLPDRAQLNRAIRRHEPELTACGRALARRLGVQLADYELLDSTVQPVRNAKRRGAGVLVEARAVGYSPRLGWVDGFRLLVCATPAGIITGFGLAPANCNDLQVAETFLTERAQPHQQVPSVGRTASGVYLADSGFAGREAQARWREVADAHVVAPPKPDSADRWPKAWRRLHAHQRQVIETVISRLQSLFRLADDRCHTLDGWLSRLAAKVALHNALITWNRHCGRPDLAHAASIGW